MNISPAGRSNANDIDIAARTAWGEARGNGIEGMTAVLCVVLNRVSESAKYAFKNHRPEWWGGTVSEVCQKPFQFSCWNKDDPNREKLLAVTEIDKQFRDAMAISWQYLENGGPDITNGATQYHSKYMPETPTWAKTMEVTAYIGDHIFYA